MKVLIACLAVVALTSPALSQSQTSPLAATYPVTVGDIAASTLSELLKIRTDLKEPTLVTYEPETHTIDVEVFASTYRANSTDAARAVLGQYWDFIQAGHIPYVERRFKTKLSTSHYRLMFYDARPQDGPKLVIQFVNGNYVIP